MSIRMEQGVIREMEIGGRRILFRREPEYAGPVFHVVYGGQEHFAAAERADAEGWRSLSFWGVRLSLKVEEADDGARILVRMKNGESQVFRPDRVSLMLGLDTYMDKYPDWNDKFFPTLLRCEKTHLWGYFRTPAGRLLGLACPQGVPSWALCYNQFFSDNGHRIYTVRLDLLTRSPQPARHPAADCLQPGEERAFTLHLFEAPDLNALLRTCARRCQAPVFLAQRLTLGPGETDEVRVFSPEAPVLEPPLPCESAGGGEWLIRLPEDDSPGRHTLLARACGHESELIFCRRRPYGFYLDRARQAAFDMPQKTGSHCESWYGFFSAFQAARYLPKPSLDRALLDRFERLLPLCFDPDAGEPTRIPHRIQNTAIAASLCEDAFRETHDVRWLERAARFSDYLVDRCQRADGAFLSGTQHYTCVVYIAKSVLEVYLAEREQPEAIWKARAQKHFSAAKRAVDELVLHLDDIGTEGEATFEDGMISCSMTQIALMGLLLPKAERDPYIRAAQTMLDKHRCLERLGSPDSRSRNTTLRFWEAQYDVLIPGNMICSPHGWSAWKIYGVWYLYLLTGKTGYLTDAMDTLGSCLQLVDEETGELRWAFVPDPCIAAGLWQPDGETGRGRLNPAVYGETYLPMISGWYRAPEDTPVFGYLGVYPGFDTDQGGCCDNDVHECFKALSETALPYAWLYPGKDGAPRAMNGHLQAAPEGLIFTPAEDLVQAVHVNLPEETRVTVRFASGEVTSRLRFGWIYRDGRVSDEPLPALC